MKSVDRVSFLDKDGNYNELWRKGRIVITGAKWFFSQMDPAKWPVKAEEVKP
jgi:hypothetical protein